MLELAEVLDAGLDSGPDSLLDSRPESVLDLVLPLDFEITVSVFGEYETLLNRVAGTDHCENRFLVLP